MREELLAYYTREMLKSMKDIGIHRVFRKNKAIHLIKLQPFFGPYFGDKGAVLKIRRPEHYKVNNA